MRRLSSNRSEVSSSKGTLCECLMFQMASLRGRLWKAGWDFISAKARCSEAADVSVLKACKVPPLEELERLEARDGSPVRESRATARLPWEGDARMRAMPEAVVGPAPMRMARPEGDMVGVGFE